MYFTNRVGINWKVDGRELALTFMMLYTGAFNRYNWCVLVTAWLCESHLVPTQTIVHITTALQITLLH